MGAPVSRRGFRFKASKFATLICRKRSPPRVATPRKETHMTQRLDVVDVSHYNTVKSWDKVKAAGVVGVIFKATEGTNYEDPTCKPQFAAALKAGLACCTY